MFTNRIFRIRKLAATSHRNFSQLSSIYPFTKLRAFPFQISPEDAIVQMAPYASMLGLFTDIIGSLGARYLPGFGFEPFRPVRITPVYFPGWIIDAEVSVEASYGDVKRTTSGVIHNSYIPGSDFQVLSGVSYFSRRDQGEPVLFTKDLEVQHGAEITCLPYTISPFAGLDMARSLSSRDATIEDIRFSPTSLNTHLLAAYPILFPLYLAQYERPITKSDGTPELMTLFIEAFGSEGRIRTQGLGLSEELWQQMPAASRSLLDLNFGLDDSNIALLRGLPSQFFTLDGFLIPEKRGIARAAAEWLNHTIVRRDAAAKLVENSGTISSDADPRIRPFSSEEQTKNTQWMLLGREIESMERVIASMKESTETARTIVAAKKKAIPLDIFDKPINILQSKVNELAAKRQETTPSWWKDWLEMSKTASRNKPS